MSEVSIHVAKENSPLLDKIIELSNRNSQTLGFLPKQVFEDRAKNPGILVALVAGKFAGYLLYAVTKKMRHARIMHLCIDNKYRGRGIAKKLNQKLIELTRDKLYGIRLNCRKDYSANKMWPKLGYVAASEKPGKKKTGSTLVCWCFDHNHPSLFDFKQEDSNLRVKAAVDSRIFYELYRDRLVMIPESCQVSESYLESVKSLDSDWLQGDLNLCITEEVFNEIQNDFLDPEIRATACSLTQEFILSRSPNARVSGQQFDYALEKLNLEIEDSNCKRNLDSELRHIARCYAIGVFIFITINNELLSWKNQIYSSLGILIMSPDEIIMRLDEIYREPDYQPCRLAGIDFEIRVIPEDMDIQNLVSVFCNMDQSETQDQFQQKLLGIRSSKSKVFLSLITYKKEPILLGACSKSGEKELLISCLRSVPNTIGATVLRWFLFDTARKAVEQSLAFTRVSDTSLSDRVEDALRENNFIKCNHKNEWLRCHLKTLLNTVDLTSRLEVIGRKQPDYQSMCSLLKSKISHNRFTEDALSIADIERLLWPIKVLETNFPNFIIPIAPEWAKELFDEDLARQTLFGTFKSEVFLSTESVYYRSRMAPGGLNPSVYGRILWYVTKDSTGGYHETQAVRACSQIDEVIVDYPERLHQRFSRLGVYSLEQLIDLSKKLDGSEKIMAIKFSGTELFQNPVPFAK